MAKTGRNDPCTCGSKKKFKKCCGDPAKQNFKASKIDDPKIAAEIKKQFDHLKAKEITRKQQQGLGKPIIATQFKDHLMVGVGSRLYAIPRGQTFPDFLGSYLPSVLGREWFNKELQAKENRHPIIEWYASFCAHQQKHFDPNEKIASMPETGLTICYLGLAYNLYLLAHNVELQQRFIKRLLDQNNFQGAYYELIVANCLIRAGFDLALEDESDESQKHCEFSAISKITGKKYWVEAKARSVAGILCKTHLNGTTDQDATGRLSVHISQAFRKPAADDRLIFVDLNAPGESDAVPSWVDRATRKLKAKEQSRSLNETAYIFVTNMNFHLYLESETCFRSAFAYGFGISDFAKPGRYTFQELYRIKKKHSDAHSILEAIRGYPRIPSTLDGSLPSETFATNPQHVNIGETYTFDNIGLATITSATVNESSGTAYFGTSNGHILTRQLSDDELADYKQHRDTFFGVIHQQGRKADTPYEFFEAMVEIHLRHSEKSILSKIAGFPNADELRKMSHEDRVLAYCERLAASLPQEQKDPL